LTNVTERSRTRLEIIEAVLLALAALLTAWAAFQSTKWGGVQANAFSRAGANRTESVRASNLANRQTVIDVDTFTSWVNAVASEVRAGVDNGFDPETGAYTPVDGTQSAFLYERFRSEFREPFDAWLAERPLANPDAPNTPFELPVYGLAADQEAQALEREAEEVAATARQANQRGDNYVMMTILFALALVLIGIGWKMHTVHVRVGLAVASGSALLLGLVVLVTFPVEV
jgi:hypothetical protein